MSRYLIVFVLLSTLPSCIAAIGNRGNAGKQLPPATAPLLRDKVASAERIVALRQQLVGNLRDLYTSGRADADTLAAAEISIEQAKLFLLDCKIELLAAEGDHKQ
jgi:hypothetical protein